MTRRNRRKNNNILIFLVALLIAVVCFVGCGDFLSQFEETKEIASDLATVSDIMSEIASDAGSFIKSEIEQDDPEDEDDSSLQGDKLKKGVKKGVEKVKEAAEATEGQSEEGILSDPSDIDLHNVGEKDKNYIFTYNGEKFSAIYTSDNWKIIDSYKIYNLEDMTIICEALSEEHPIHGSDLRSYRTPDDMAYEWDQHNIAYAFLPDDSTWKVRTKDVDLNPADQGLSFTEIYERQTGKQLTIDELMNHLKEG